MKGGIRFHSSKLGRVPVPGHTLRPTPLWCIPSFLRGLCSSEVRRRHHGSTKNIRELQVDASDNVFFANVRIQARESQPLARTLCVTAKTKGHKWPEKMKAPHLCDATPACSASLCAPVSIARKRGWLSRRKTRCGTNATW